MTNHSTSPTRRRILHGLVACTAAPFVAAATSLGTATQPAASERMTLGIVGLGARGFNLLDQFLAEKDVQIVAICDVQPLHYRDLAWGKGTAYGLEPAKRRIDSKYNTSPAMGVTTTSDYRELCSRKDIDAVVVATPDHWHALCTLEAIQQGKDVYCEKPLTHTFFEGQVVYRKAAARKAVFQTGSQQRSDPRFIAAAKIVQSGVMGNIDRFEVGLPRGYAKPQGDVDIVEPPKDLDYDRWCGPSEKLAYRRAIHHRWWRGNRAYGGGVLMDWIGHHNDIAHLALKSDRSGPMRVESVGWQFPDTPIYDTPQDYEIQCAYPGNIQSSISNKHPEGLRIYGENGWLHVRRGQLTVSSPAWLETLTKPGKTTGYDPVEHARNFIDCFKSRSECAATAEIGHRSVTPGHLGYVSQALGRSLRWDAVNEVVVDDAEANQLLTKHVYRSPWDQRFRELS
ncbi:MAG: Gfo/Idh/MocA family oxidoreductase [Pirellula sp.]